MPVQQSVPFHIVRKIKLFTAFVCTIKRPFHRSRCLYWNIITHLFNYFSTMNYVGTKEWHDRGFSFTWNVPIVEVPLPSIVSQSPHQSSVQRLKKSDNSETMTSQNAVEASVTTATSRNDKTKQNATSIPPIFSSNHKTGFSFPAFHFMPSTMIFLSMEGRKFHITRRTYILHTKTYQWRKNRWTGFQPLSVPLQDYAIDSATTCWVSRQGNRQ